MARAELHQLIDDLPDASVDAVGILLRRAQDPVMAELDAAPWDDEPVTAEDRRAVDAARSEPGVPFQQALAELDTD